jgi:hypothetical protein
MTPMFSWARLAMVTGILTAKEFFSRRRLRPSQHGIEFRRAEWPVTNGGVKIEVPPVGIGA